jgi:hypothetical protein
VDFGVGRVAQTVEDGRGDVLRLDTAVARAAADAVGGAVYLAAADAAARQRRGKDVAPMVAAA